MQSPKMLKFVKVNRISLLLFSFDRKSFAFYFSVFSPHHRALEHPRAKYQSPCHKRDHVFLKGFFQISLSIIQHFNARKDLKFANVKYSSLKCIYAKRILIYTRVRDKTECKFVKVSAIFESFWTKRWWKVVKARKKLTLMDSSSQRFFRNYLQ